MTCPFCGFVNEENSVLCKACGTRFQEKQQVYNVSRNQYYETNQNNNQNNQSYIQYPQQQPVLPSFQQPTYNSSYNNFNNYDQTTYGNLYHEKNTNQLSMTFNTLYAIWLLFSAFSNITSVISMLSISSEYSYGILGFIFSLIPLIYLTVTGIFLLKKTKLGYILCKIRNIFNIIAYSFIAIASVILIIFSAANADYFAVEDGTLAPLFIVLGIIFVVACAITIVLNIVVMKYYKKRKHLFN